MEVDGQEFSSGGLLNSRSATSRDASNALKPSLPSVRQHRAPGASLQGAICPRADLDAAKKRLEALEKDIEVNPVPPPAWLRAGAPVDSEAFRAGKGLRGNGPPLTKEGWFVLGQDVKGEFAVPYTEVLDKQGMPMYEAREFQAPEVIEKPRTPILSVHPVLMARRTRLSGGLLFSVASTTPPWLARCRMLGF